MKIQSVFFEEVILQYSSYKEMFFFQFIRKKASWRTHQEDILQIKEQTKQNYSINVYKKACLQDKEHVYLVFSLFVDIRPLRKHMSGNFLFCMAPERLSLDRAPRTYLLYI